MKSHVKQIFELNIRCSLSCHYLQTIIFDWSTSLTTPVLKKKKKLPLVGSGSLKDSFPSSKVVHTEQNNVGLLRT